MVNLIDFKITSTGFYKFLYKFNHQSNELNKLICSFLKKQLKTIINILIIYQLIIYSILIKKECKVNFVYSIF